MVLAILICMAGCGPLARRVKRPWAKAAPEAKFLLTSWPRLPRLGAESLSFGGSSYLGLRLAAMRSMAMDHAWIDFSRMPLATPGLSSRARFLLRPQLLTRT